MMRIQQINWNLDSVSWKTQHPTPDIADLSIPKCQVHLLRIYLLQQTWDSFSFHLWVTSKWFPAFKKGTTLFFHFWNYINYSSSISFGPSPCFSPTICPKFEMQNLPKRPRLVEGPLLRTIWSWSSCLLSLSFQTENNKWENHVVECGMLWLTKTCGKRWAWNGTMNPGTKAIYSWFMASFLKLWVFCGVWRITKRTSKEPWTISSFSTTNYPWEATYISSYCWWNLGPPRMYKTREMMG